MASVKVVLRNRMNKDGTSSIALRFIQNRKSSYTHIGHSIDEKYWDEKNSCVKKSHPNSARLNNLILKKLTEATDKLLEMEGNKTHVTAKSIKKGLKAKHQSSFFAQAAIYLDILKQSGKYNRYSADKPRIERFREFLKGEDIFFSDVNVALLNRFQAFLKGTRKISDRTIVNHLVVIRSVFSQAIKGNVTEAKYYPFGKDQIRIKFPESVKISLSIEELKRLEEAELSAGSYPDHARNLWLISFYFAGMRISDLLRLRWSDLSNERLHYAMGKNAKAGSLKIPEKAAALLENYKAIKRTEDDLIFHHLRTVKDMNDKFDVQKKISNATKSIDEALQKVALAAKIKKKITMHIARHTFGNLSGDRIPIQMLQKLYRHTSITTTIAYQSQFIHKDTDEALDSVLDY